MIKYPRLLENPNDPALNLQEAEIYLFKEASELISIQHYAYSLFAIWNSVIINLQRRIETFGIENFLNIIEDKQQYNKEGNSLKDRWLNVNEYKLVEYARKLNLISHTTHDLITMIYWMKSSTSTQTQENIDEQELYSILYLLEKNLFLKVFKHDMRTQKHAEISEKRRKDDREEINTNLSKDTSLNKPINSKVHEELLLKSNMKKFEKQTKEEEEEHLLDKYI